MELTLVKKIELKDVKYSFIFSDKTNIYLVSKLSNTIDKFNENLELVAHFEFRYDYIDICYSSTHNVFYGLKLDEATKNTIVEIININNNNFQKVSSHKINLNTTPTGIKYNESDDVLCLTLIDKVLIVSLKTFKPVKTIPLVSLTDINDLDSLKDFESWLKLNKHTYPTQYLSSTRLLDVTSFDDLVVLLERVTIQKDFTTVISCYNIVLNEPKVLVNNVIMHKDREVKNVDNLAITFAEDLDLEKNLVGVGENTDVDADEVSDDVIDNVLGATATSPSNTPITTERNNSNRRKSTKSKHIPIHNVLGDFHDISLDDLNFNYLQFEDFDVENDINYGTREDLNFTDDLNNKCNDILADIDLVEVNLRNFDNDNNDCENNHNDKHCEDDKHDDCCECDDDKHDNCCECDAFNNNHNHEHDHTHKNACKYDCDNKYDKNCDKHEDNNHCNDKCDEILHSIANVELGIAHILHSEGMKIQKVVKCSDSVCDILEVNNSVIEVIEKVTKLEDALCCKLKALKDVCPKKDVRFR